ncbi:MAG: hypothetical protein KAI47_10210, partial [Deltaproteobacteria bacterium]|nr:hypothetical protein [Deltaproteobacteria bacterium]
GRPYDTKISAPYPIHATWMYNRSACQWQDTLEAFHRQGGKAVWQFGPGFEVRSASFLKSDPKSKFTNCKEGSAHCVDKAWADLHAVNASNKVANYLTYAFKDNFSKTILRCPALDRKITVGKRTYWRLVLPHNPATIPFTCNFNGGTFDILFVWSEGADAKEPLLRVADKLKMNVFMAMPQMPHKDGAGWDVEMSLRPAFLEWSHRVLSDYKSRHGAHASFVGIYQTFEVRLTESGGDRVYDTYGKVAKLVHGVLPGKIFALSPYWSVKTSSSNPTVTSAAKGFKRLARQGVDLIAPQDGRGVGSSGLFWPYEKDTKISTVDPLFVTNPLVNGSHSFAQEFTAPTRELFAAVQGAVHDLKSQEGRTVTLWVNVEAFESYLDPKSHPGDLDYPKRLIRRTEKQRIDRALTHEGAYGARIISFMWDPFFISKTGGYALTVHDEITKDFARPIASQAFFWKKNLVVHGFHLAVPGTKFKLTWFDSAWKSRSLTLSPGTRVAGWGASHDRSPLLDEVWLAFDSSTVSLAPHFFVHITPVSPTGKAATHKFSMAY